MKFFFEGIWTRLLLAFSTIAAITVIVGVMALLIFEHSGELFESITERHIPAVVQVVDFAEIGGEIIAVAPRLLSAADDKVRTAIQNDIFHLLLRINQQIELLDIASTGFRTEVENLASRLEGNLIALQKSVINRLKLQKQLNRKTENLRWLYADLLDEVDPLNQDYAYNLDIELERLIDAVKRRDQIISAARLQTNRRSKETIETIRSNSVLLVSLMAQASTSSGLEQINNLATLAGDSIALLRHDISKLNNDASSLTLKQALDGIFVLAEGNQSVFAISTDIIEGEIREQKILSKNSDYVNRLRGLIDEIIAKTQEDTIDAVENSRNTLKHARWLLVTMVISSLLISGSVLWFYVKGSIVARLVALSRSMQAIAGGDLVYEVPKAGRDEIGQMAAALRIFRDTEQAQQLLRQRVREKTDHLSRVNLELRQEVTERRKAQNELIQAGKLAALGQLSAGIAHEMNQPLSAIRYYLHNARKLLERGQIESHEENLGKVGELIERMAKMINHLKTFARWRTDKLSPIDVVPVIEHALALVAAKLDNNSVQIFREFLTTPKIVYGDSVRLEQVFVNIINNAIDAVGEKPLDDRKIIIEANESENEVVIDIVDNGYGIPPNNLDAVFDPFFTTKEVGKGLGLGLSISFSIIEGFGGSITAGTEKEGLTRFSILLRKTKG